MITILKGNIVSAPALGELDITEQGYLVAEDGVITGVFPELPPQYRNAAVEDWGDCLILQSLADLHVHGPQYAMMAMGMDLPLLDWLNTYAFPVEARFSDPEYARRVYRALARELLDLGTTRVIMFSSLHTDGTLILMEELDMPREMVYLQIVAGDTYIMLNEIKWGGSEAIMCAVGQSITAVTPVAVARYVAAIANGGEVYDLRLIDSIISPEGEVISQSSPILASELDCPEEYLQAIREGMKGVVDPEGGGTATKYFSDFSYKDEIGAKTGTAEKTDIDLENNAWMVAFAPYDDPEIAMVVYIPNGYSGAHCSPTIRDVLEYYLDQRLIQTEDFMAPSNSLAY